MRTGYNNGYVYITKPGRNGVRVIYTLAFREVIEKWNWTIGHVVTKTDIWRVLTQSYSGKEWISVYTRDKFFDLVGEMSKRN